MHYFETHNEIKIFFNEFGEYNDIEKLFEKFKLNLDAKLEDKLDGPYSRIWKIVIQDEEFKLVVDEVYGSMLVAKTPSAIKKAKELLEKIKVFVQ